MDTPPWIYLAFCAGRPRGGQDGNLRDITPAEPLNLSLSDVKGPQHDSPNTQRETSRPCSRGEGPEESVDPKFS
jgi:hypothetical protein